MKAAVLTCIAGSDAEQRRSTALARRARGRGEAETDKGPVDFYPAERARQEAEPRLSSGAGKRSAESAE